VLHYAASGFLFCIRHLAFGNWHLAFGIRHCGAGAGAGKGIA